MGAMKSTWRFAYWPKLNRRRLLAAAAGTAAAATLRPRGEGAHELSASYPVAGAPFVTVNDLSQIQAALDAVPAGGGTVLLPAGVVALGSPLTIPTSYTTLRGAGGRLNINDGSMGATLLRLAPGFNCSPIQIAPNVAGATIEELSLDCTGQSAGNGIDASSSGTVFLTVRRVGILAPQAVGIWLAARGGNIIEDSVVRQAGTFGFDGGGPTNYIAGNLLSGCSNGGRVAGYESSVVGNTFDDSANVGLVVDADHVTATGNRFINAGGAGLQVTQHVGVVVASNLVEIRPGTSSAYGIQITLSATLARILLASNIVDCDAGAKGTAAGIYVSSSVAGAELVKIIGNYIEGFAGGGAGISTSPVPMSSTLTSVVIRSRTVRLPSLTAARGPLSEPIKGTTLKDLRCQRPCCQERRARVAQSRITPATPFAFTRRGRVAHILSIRPRVTTRSASIRPRYRSILERRFTGQRARQAPGFGTARSRQRSRPPRMR